MSAEISTPSTPRRPPGRQPNARANGPGRLRRSLAAAALVACALLAHASFPGRLAAGESDRAGGTADIELRKSVQRAPRAGRQTSAPDRPGNRDGDEPGTAAGTRASPGFPDRLSAAATALGEPLRTSGALHLPGVDGREIVLDGGQHPVLEYGTGRRAILDTQGTLGPRVAAEIGRLWPEYTVVQPHPEGDVRALLGEILDAAGYASVTRSTPVSFGRGVTVRVAPDFVVLKADRDLLDGETLLLSVVERADALPPELRELAAGHRLRTVELDRDGATLGSDRAPWTDPIGRVTTMEVRRPWLVLSEIAAAIGLAVDPKVALPTTGAGAPLLAAARVSGGSRSALILAQPPDPTVRAALADLGETAIVVSKAEELPGGIRALLDRFGVAAIGPRVELRRAARPATPPRFTISVPGWLVDTGGRRLLVTGAAPQALVKRFLSREAIDILEYRVREPEKP